jgi:phosphocarrier protein HPr
MRRGPLRSAAFVGVVTVVVEEHDMTRREVVVTNELGLHARAAAKFVHLATQFTSQIRVGRATKMMDGKSIMGILLLAAAQGTTLTITANGRDEAAAVDALVRLVESGFGEPSESPGPGETWNA